MEELKLNIEERDVVIPNNCAYCRNKSICILNQKYVALNQEANRISDKNSARLCALESLLCSYIRYWDFEGVETVDQRSKPFIIALLYGAISKYLTAELLDVKWVMPIGIYGDCVSCRIFYNNTELVHELDINVREFLTRVNFIYGED